MTLLPDLSRCPQGRNRYYGINACCCGFVHNTYTVPSNPVVSTYHTVVPTTLEEEEVKDCLICGNTLLQSEGSCSHCTCTLHFSPPRIEKKRKCHGCRALVSRPLTLCPICYTRMEERVKVVEPTNRVPVGIKQLPHAEGLPLPEYAHEGDSGFDLRAAIPEGWMWRLMPLSHLVIPTGIVFNIPKGYEIQIRPRSGLAAKNGVWANFGTVDGPYLGEVSVIMFNLGPETLEIWRGDKLTQGVLAPVTIAQWVDYKEKETDRGVNGFGSTGV